METVLGTVGLGACSWIVWKVLGEYPVSSTELAASSPALYFQSLYFPERLVYRHIYDHPLLSFFVAHHGWCSLMALVIISLSLFLIPLLFVRQNVPTHHPSSAAHVTNFLWQSIAIWSSVVFLFETKALFSVVKTLYTNRIVVESLYRYSFMIAGLVILALWAFPGQLWLYNTSDKATVSKLSEYTTRRKRDYVLAAVIFVFGVLGSTAVLLNFFAVATVGPMFTDLIEPTNLSGNILLVLFGVKEQYSHALMFYFMYFYQINGQMAGHLIMFIWCLARWAMPGSIDDWNTLSHTRKKMTILLFMYALVYLVLACFLIGLRLHVYPPHFDAVDAAGDPSLIPVFGPGFPSFSYLVFSLALFIFSFFCAHTPNSKKEKVM